MPLRLRSLLAIWVTVAALIAAAAVYRAGTRRPSEIFRAGGLPPARLLPVRCKSPLLAVLAGGQWAPVQLSGTEKLGVGKLLVASRNLGDPNFAKTVVLVVRYQEDGVMGLILNRRTDLPLSRVLDLKAAKDRSDLVYAGGPVQPAAVAALFQAPAAGKAPNAAHMFGSLYLITDKDVFEQTLSTRPNPGVFRVFLGYAGWTPEQLKHEVQLGAWFVFPADAATVFSSDPDSLWPQMIQKTTLDYALAEPQAAAWFWWNCFREAARGARPREWRR